MHSPRIPSLNHSLSSNNLQQLHIMECHIYYRPPTPAPESVATLIATPPEETRNCQDSCCDGNDAEPLDTTALGYGEATQEQPDDCCSPGKSSDNKTENDTDAPDCCRGKVSPCCDTTCLDRLALRACEMSAAIASGPNGQPNSE